MLVATGVLLGVVLVVMVGGTALSFEELGWLPDTPTPFAVPTWMGAWFELYSSWETLGAQVLAAAFVIGSYVVAERVRVAAPLARGETPARRADVAA
jgi:high-affinity iron transporter